MDKAQVFHAYSRFGFGTSYTKASKITSRKSLINTLFKVKSEDLALDDLPSIEQLKSWRKKPDFKKKLKKLLKDKDAEINGTWVENMASTEAQLIEKMTLFWHGHFACQTRNPYYQLQLNNILRNHAVGNFRDLLIGVSKSAAMIDYLHLKQNKKSSPNEDFARELCELFTLGRDVLYTENDVKEIARAFTGWMHQLDGTFFFNERKHDSGSKTIFGQTKNYSGEEVIDLILKQKECAKFICAKFYRYFINPTISEKHLSEISNVLYSSNYDLSSLIKHVLNADWFYSSENIGKKIKSPIELLIGVMRSFNMRANDFKTYVIYQRVLEQHLFHPPNVAGWPGDQYWIDSARLSIRLRFSSLVLNGGKFEFDPRPDNDAKPMENTVGLGRKATMKSDWGYYFKRNPEDISHESVLLRAPIIRATQKLIEQNSFETTKEKVLYLMSLPEYQMC